MTFPLKDWKGGFCLKAVGRSFFRKDAINKVTGAAKYTADLKTSGTLYAELIISPYAHAEILRIDLSAATKLQGVVKILTGRDSSLLTGEEIRDRPIIAKDRIRHHGEVVAMVIAETQHEAKKAAGLIRVAYKPIPVVNSVSAALMEDAPLIHERLGDYKKINGVYPIPGTNICNHTKIRKGNAKAILNQCAYTAEEVVSMPVGDHAAIELRSASAERSPDGNVIIYSSSQVPFAIKKWISRLFQIGQENITVHTPLVGGAYGGKSAIQLEFLVMLATLAVNGQKVSLTNTRERDFITSPSHIGLDAKVKIGSDEKGLLKAAEIFFYFDGGAYSDKATDMSRAAAIDCTGPYKIDHLTCDSYCVYTNHPYATSFRGFGHAELTFAIERTMDVLAKQIGIDPSELRYINVIQTGELTPTGVRLTDNNIGDLRKCIEKARALINWDNGQFSRVNQDIVRAKGFSCFWKTSNIASNASSGALVLFNNDGSVMLSCGVSEIGTGSRSVLAQIAAERLQMDIRRINIQMDVDTNRSPEHWKTVASRGLWMAGNAVLAAADDAINQLLQAASRAFQVALEDLYLANGFVHSKSKPEKRVSYSDLAYGYTYPNGNTVGGQIIGRGTYTLQDMTLLDPETGQGNPGPDWTIGAEAVEVEFNTRTYMYSLLQAVAVLDAGTIINPALAVGQIKGGMSMGLSYASREAFVYDDYARVLTHQFRTYKVLRYGENPSYTVDFVNTPSRQTAYGLRGLGEHGIIGIPAALASALSFACGVQLFSLPLLPESIWRACQNSGSL